jgi:7-carboxy-7-deazaguanine synthase
MTMELLIFEIFSSFQGEGIHTGLPTTFIRLSGCNLDCKWCDTRYALDPSSGRPMSITEIVQKVKELGNEMVCITGGEPLIQENTYRLVESLLEIGCRVDIETNGTMDFSHYSSLGEKVFLSVDVKTPSSGEDGSFLMDNIVSLRGKDQLKFIIGSPEDIRFSVKLIGSADPGCELIFTPVNNIGGDVLAEELMHYIQDGALPGRRTRLMVQTHKVIWPQDRKGV